MQHGFGRPQRNNAEPERVQSRLQELLNRLKGINSKKEKNVGYMQMLDTFQPVLAANKQSGAFNHLSCSVITKKRDTKHGMTVLTES